MDVTIFPRDLKLSPIHDKPAIYKGCLLFQDMSSRGMGMLVMCGTADELRAFAETILGVIRPVCNLDPAQMDHGEPASPESEDDLERGRR